MDKCITCQYYDRKHANSAASSTQQWGQCRRTAPMLNPANTKSYMIEGIWPTIRDDDWCGEWKVLARRVESRVAEVLNTPATANPQSLSPPATRIGPLTATTHVNGYGVAGANPAGKAAASVAASLPSSMGAAGND